MALGADAQGRRKQAKPASSARLVVPAKAETIRFQFDESREPRTRSFTLQANPPLPRKPVLQKELAGDLESETGREFPKDQVSVVAARTEFGNVDVKVTLDPKAGTDVPAGRYTGTLAVAGRQVEPGVVTIDAALRDRPGEAFLWAVLGFLTGLAIKVAGDFSRAKPSMPAAPTRSPTAKEYFRSGAFISSSLLGLAGATVAFAIAYYGNPTWGGDGLDGWKLAAAAFAGVLTGATGADVIKPLRPPSSR